MTAETAEPATEEMPLASKENFAELLEESLGERDRFEGQVIKGTVVVIENDAAVIDVGLKSEGRIPLKEFSVPGEELVLKAGDRIDVFVER